MGRALRIFEQAVFTGAFSYVKVHSSVGNQRGGTSAAQLLSILLNS